MLSLLVEIGWVGCGAEVEEDFGEEIILVNYIE
jgi:hypothetical protein